VKLSKPWAQPKLDEEPSMHRAAHIGLTAMALLCLLLLSGCDGDGLKGFEGQPSVSGDSPNTGDDGGGGVDPGPAPGGGGGGGGGGTVRPRFQGTWFSSYEDDEANQEVTIGVTQNVATMTIVESGAQISGTGRLFRTYLGQPEALQEVTFRITGNRESDNDAVITWDADRDSDFQLPPRWRFRLAGTIMVGFFEELTTSNVLGRTGHAVWRRESATANVNTTWAAAYSDSFGAEGFTARDRTGVVTLVAADDLLAGTGLLVEQRVNDVVADRNFEVTRGLIESTQAGFTFGSLDLAPNEEDWVTFYTEGHMYGLYTQFNLQSPDMEAIRFGHATWHQMPNAGPDAIDGVWTASFTDTTAAVGLAASDYLAHMTLDARDNNRVVGSAAQIRDNGFDKPDFLSYEVRDATIIGSRIRMDLIGPSSFFSWDMHLAGSVLVGAYQQFDGAGNFMSRGVGEWRPQSTNSDIRGSWTTSYADTFVTGEGSPKQTQFVRITISSQGGSGDLAGSGLLYFAGEGGARIFNVSGSIDLQNITWFMSGPGIFGSTTWNLRRVNGGLVGTYENFNSAGSLEARGQSFWYATSG
jgi:hypothetical protein